MFSLKTSIGFFLASYSSTSELHEQAQKTNGIILTRIIFLFYLSVTQNRNNDQKKATLVFVMDLKEQ